VAMGLFVFFVLCPLLVNSYAITLAPTKLCHHDTLPCHYFSL